MLFLAPPDIPAEQHLTEGITWSPQALSQAGFCTPSIQPLTVTNRGLINNAVIKKAGDPDICNECSKDSVGAWGGDL